MKIGQIWIKSEKKRDSKIYILVLLNLTAASYIIDHYILIAQLMNYVGMSGTVLTWFSFYLKDRRFSVLLWCHRDPFLHQLFSPCICFLWGLFSGNIGFLLTVLSFYFYALLLLSVDVVKHFGQLVLFLYTGWIRQRKFITIASLARIFVYFLWMMRGLIEK